MNYKIYFLAILAFIYVSCNSSHQNNHQEHNHEEHNHEDNEHDDHNEYGEQDHDHEEHEHEDHKVQYTVYGEEFELYAEADAFIKGEMANFLCHITSLEDFAPITEGSITLSIIIDDKVTSETLSAPTKKGIYSFNITPESVGKGRLELSIKSDQGNCKITVPEIMVYASDEQADEAISGIEYSTTNTISFTKEQSWKIDFATEKATVEPFGQVIKTTAQIQSANNDEVIVTAKSNGIVRLSNNAIVEGKKVNRGEVLFSITGNGLAENNPSIQYTEAQNNYLKAKTDFERLNELAKDKIVSEKELLNAQNLYDNTKAVYNSLSKNFNAQGQMITSSVSGSIKQLYVTNGQHVQTGDPVMIVSQNKYLVLHAEVQSKFASELQHIKTATFRCIHNNTTYTMNELNGKVLAVGNSANNDNYLLPVHLQIDNPGQLISGSFVELFIQTITNSNAITIPNTALLEEQGTFFVFVQITPELFEKREVITGASNGIKTEILSNLNAHKRVVSKGAIMVKLAQSTGALDAHSGHVH